MARPKKIVEEVTSTGVNGHNPDISTVELPKVDALLPYEGESAEHARVREIYIKTRQQNPIAWEYDKARLLDILSKL